MLARCAWGKRLCVQPSGVRRPRGHSATPPASINDRSDRPGGGGSIPVIIPDARRSKTDMSWYPFEPVRGRRTPRRMLDGAADDVVRGIVYGSRRSWFHVGLPKRVRAKLGKAQQQIGNVPVQREPVTELRPSFGPLCSPGSLHQLDDPAEPIIKALYLRLQAAHVRFNQSSVLVK
jgi:hypothetical protein